MDDTSKAVGIDIGGTKMAVAAVDGTGAIRARRLLATEADLGFMRAVDRLGGAIVAVLEECGWRQVELCGIGIGCAGPVDPAHGLINNPYTLGGWDKCDIVTPLRERFGVPAYLENDADAAALGECFVGAGRGADPVAMLTFGTGIGGAVVLRGKIYRGVNGEHPELGHMPVSADGPVCYCGTRGCLESLASGTAIGEAGRMLGMADAREVFAAARAGNPAAERLVARALEATASAAWTLLHTFLPERIVLGGGMMAEHYELFAPVVRERIKAATMAPGSRISVLPAALGNDAGLVGAASLAFSGRAPAA